MLFDKSLTDQKGIIVIMDMQSLGNNYDRINGRKRYIEECIKQGKPVKHRKDLYMVSDVKLVQSAAFHKQLYFIGFLVKDVKAH